MKLKTAKQWIEELDEKEYPWKQKALYNIENQTINDETIYSSIGDSIKCFIWCITPEGVDYWYSTYKSLRNENL